jgi:beta-lactam-binding protein with PASTA domain
VLVPVPAVVDGSLADATAALESAGLAVGTVTEAASTSAAGSVTSSAPAAGVGVGAGSAVDLVVASGSNLVPPVSGLQRDAAFAAVQQAGFGVLITTVDDASAAKGTVLATSPAGGAQLALGRPVTLTVAAGPSPTPSPAPTATPTADPAAGRSD